MTGMLASVRDLREAACVYANGADIIDLKEPDLGTLGAVPLAEIRHIVDELWEKCTISATVGDLPANAFTTINKVLQTAETGVDYVKVGIFSQHHLETCLPKLIHCTNQGIAIVAVLFADVRLDIDFAVRAASRARLKGVMLDTARKNSGGLLQQKKPSQLDHFIRLAKCNGLLTGLAGSLKINDIPTLLQLNPDYLGFRTALCAAADRSGKLDMNAIRQVRENIPMHLQNHLSMATDVPTKAASRKERYS